MQDSGELWKILVNYGKLSEKPSAATGKQLWKLQENFGKQGGFGKFGEQLRKIAMFFSFTEFSRISQEFLRKFSTKFSLFSKIFQSFPELSPEFSRSSHCFPQFPKCYQVFQSFSTGFPSFSIIFHSHIASIHMPQNISFTSSCTK